MPVPFSRTRIVWVILLSSLFTVGCTSTPGRGLSLFPEGHPLSETAKELRWANAGPLQIPRELEKQPLPPYVVEPGDVLLVQPVDLDSPVRLPGDQPVLPDGTINLGRFGQLIVAGKTVPEVEGMVRGTVQSQVKEAGFISVRLVSRQSKVYYVVGEVNSPGAFPLNGRETVLDAIMAAGGLTTNASPDNIVLSKPSKPNCCRTVLPVCYRHIVQLGDTTTNYQLAPGDRIYVPSRSLLETVFGCHGRHEKTPCCGVHTPCLLPPYQGGPCCDNPAAAPLVPSDPGPLTTHPATEPLQLPAPNTLQKK
jgi:polysaccharide biosynthesis/export protein